MSDYRPLSDWERERWQEIVHACTSRPGGVEFGPQAKAVILGVARQLEETEAELDAERARADRAERRLSQEQEAMHADLRTLLEVLGLPSGAQPKSPHEVMLGAVEEVRKRIAALEAELAAEQERVTQLECERDNWIETAQRHNRNEDYYRSLVVSIGDMFGVEARTADDGTVMDDVLCAKVPELVATERKQADEAEQQITKALALLYEQMGGPNPSTLVPAVKLVIENALETMRLCVEHSAKRQAAEAREEACRTAFYQEVNHRVQCQEATRAAEAREAALRAALVNLVNVSQVSEIDKCCVRLPKTLIDHARDALAQPSPTAERIKALEEEHRLAIEYVRATMLDENALAGKWAEAIDSAEATWRAAVQAVEEQKG